MSRRPLADGAGTIQPEKGATRRFKYPELCHNSATIPTSRSLIRAVVWLMLTL